MSRRRVNWVRKILLILFWGVFLLLFGVLIAVDRIRDDSFFRAELAEAMADKTPPVIELSGGDNVVMALGDQYYEPGVAAYDESSEPSLEIDNGVNMNEVGEYEVRYKAVDEASNTAFASRKVKVIQPTGRIYLTFDDGPSNFTNTLLDILKKYGVKATFFVTSYGDDALVRREFEEGHTVALHSASHVYSYIYENIDNFFTDLDAVNERVKNITGDLSKLIRFPGGSSNLISAYYDGGDRIMSKLTKEVTARGFIYFDWNVDSNDAGGASSADEVYNNVVTTLHYGGDSIVLQHDTKDFSIDAVERIIQYGLQNGFVFDRLHDYSFTAHHGVNN